MTISKKRRTWKHQTFRKQTLTENSDKLSTSVPFCAVSWSVISTDTTLPYSNPLQTDVDALRNKNLQIERLFKVSMGFFPSSINILGEMRKTTTNSNFPEKQAIRANFSYPIESENWDYYFVSKIFPGKARVFKLSRFWMNKPRLKKNILHPSIAFPFWEIHSTSEVKSVDA